MKMKMKMKRFLIKEYLISLLVLAGFMFLILGEKSYAFRGELPRGNYNIYGEPLDKDGNIRLDKKGRIIIRKKAYQFPALNSDNFMGVQAGPVTYTDSVSIAIVKHLHFGSFNILDPIYASEVTTDRAERRLSESGDSHDNPSSNVTYPDPEDLGHPGEFIVLTNRPRELVLLVDKSQREVMKVTPREGSEDDQRGVTKKIDLTPTVRPQAPVVAEEDSNKVVGGPSGNIGLTDNGRGWFVKSPVSQLYVKSGYDIIKACKAGKDCKDVGEAANFVFLPGEIIPAIESNPFPKNSQGQRIVADGSFCDTSLEGAVCRPRTNPSLEIWELLAVEFKAEYYQRYGYGWRTDPKTRQQVWTPLFVRGWNRYDRTVLGWGRMQINKVTPGKFLPRTYYRIVEKRVLVGSILGRNPIVVGHSNNGAPIYEPKKRFNPRSEGDLGPFSTYTIKKVPNTELYRIKFLVHASLHFDSVRSADPLDAKMVKLLLGAPQSLGFLIIKVAYN